MSFLLFIVLIVVLIVAHEFGHLVVAKLSGMRVDEFGIGYPPKIYGKKFGETEYSINWLPFGGFVRIYGEDATDDTVLASKKAFAARPRLYQALTLVAGIAMNLLLAYVLISLTLAVGTPRALDPSEVASAPDAVLTVSDVLPGSPADVAGLKVGDEITAARIGASASSRIFSGTDADAFLRFVASDASSSPIEFLLTRDGASTTLSAAPKAGTITDDPNRVALGVSVVPVGTVPEPLLRAPIDGASLTWEVTKETAVGLAQFLWSAVTLHANLSEVSGPIGIAYAAGSAYAQGFMQLVSFAAIISINLAIVNLLPIPALDGGRLLFVIIEAITRRRISPTVASYVNAVCFALLILLMLVVSGHDIWVRVH